MNITDHAYKRAKERLGLSKVAFDRICAKTIKTGITHEKTKGRLYKWLTSVAMSKKFKPSLYLYSDFTLICLAETIITVLKTPRNLLPLSKYTKV